MVVSTFSENLILLGTTLVAGLVVEAFVLNTQFKNFRQLGIITVKDLVGKIIR